jgi:hypothetical protein
MTSIIASLKFLNKSTIKCDYKRENGQLVEIKPAEYDKVISEPITHTWGNVTPNVKLKYSVTIKNFGATVKGKIYFGASRPNNTNPSLTPPTEGNTSDYPFEDTNNNNTIGYKILKPDLVLRHEASNAEICTIPLNQKVYWTFGTPQTEINKARMDVAVGNVFSDQTKTDTKQILQDMLNKNGVVNFNIGKNITDVNAGVARNWNRLDEDGIDCISHSEFFQKIIKASGLPVTAGVQTYIATYALGAEPKRPETPIEGSFGWVRVGTNNQLAHEPAFPQGGALQATNATKADEIAVKLATFGPNHNASLVFYSGTGPNATSNNYEAVIHLKDTNTNTIYYNPGGFKFLYSENERKYVITKHMTTLEWQFWKKVRKINPTTREEYDIYMLQDRVVDYNYTPTP